jgi:hypothetical protein
MLILLYTYIDIVIRNYCLDPAARQRIISYLEVYLVVFPAPIPAKRLRLLSFSVIKSVIPRRKPRYGTEAHVDAYGPATRMYWLYTVSL